MLVKSPVNGAVFLGAFGMVQGINLAHQIVADPKAKKPEDIVQISEDARRMAKLHKEAVEPLKVEPVNKSYGPDGKFRVL